MTRIEFMEDCKDKQNMIIPSGSIAWVKKELINPVTKNEELFIAIENGTEKEETYPKAVIEKQKAKYREII